MAGQLRDAMPEINQDHIGEGKTLQRMQTSYATAIAVQKPRDLAQVQKRLTQEAYLGGEDFYYGWGAGKDRIEGASVKLAMAAARCWMNCAVEALPVQELADSWVFTAAFVDLETGFTIQRQFRMSKNYTVHGKMDAERKADIRFQIGQSKALRNVILNAVPISLIEQAIETAKSGVRAKLENYIKANGQAAACDIILKELAKLGVQEPSVLERFAVAARTALKLEDLVVMRGYIKAIRDGQERPEVLFPAGGRYQQDATAADVQERIRGKGPAPEVLPVPTSGEGPEPELYAENEGDANG